MFIRLRLHPLNAPYFLFVLIITCPFSLYLLANVFYDTYFTSHISCTVTKTINLLVYSIFTRYKGLILSYIAHLNVRKCIEYLCSYYIGYEIFIAKERFETIHRILNS